MRVLITFAIVLGMPALIAAQAPQVPKAITDPKEIASVPNAQVEKTLSIEKLYMTRQVGAADW